MKPYLLLVRLDKPTYEHARLVPALEQHAASVKQIFAGGTFLAFAYKSETGPGVIAQAFEDDKVFTNADAYIITELGDFSWTYHADA